MNYVSWKFALNPVLMIGLLMALEIFSSCEHKKDTGKCIEDIADSLLQNGKDSLSTNTISARNILKNVMELTKDSMKYYEAYEAYGTSFITSNQLDSGIFIKQRVLHYLNKQPYSKEKERLLSSTYNGIGNIYSLRIKPDSALIFYKQALNENIDQESRINITINIADQYKQKSNYANAIFYLRKALFTCDSLNITQLRFPVFLALGDIYLGLKDYKNTDFYSSAAEKDYPDRKVIEKIVFCNNRGNYYYYIKNYQKAKYWFNQEKVLAEKSRHIYFANLSYMNLADIYLNLEKLDSCAFYADKAEKYFQSIHFEIASHYINTVRIGLAIKQQNYALANRLKEQIDNDKEIPPYIVSIRNNYLETLSLKQNDYQNAYRYLKANMLLNDSIRSDITQKRIEELDMRYKQDTTLMGKEILIQKQNAQVEALKISTYIWILVSILIILTSSFIYFIIKKKHSMQRMNYLEQVARLRMTNIRNRISPHFMFNVLNNEVEGLDEKKKNSLYALVHLLRKSLDMTEQVSIKLSDEIDFAKAYIELEKHRLGENFSMEWDIASNIDISQIKIFPMMLQIPVENALKHGLCDLEREKKLAVNIHIENEGIIIIISDNGKGYHPEKVSHSSGTGTGLKVLRQTIQILNSRNTEKITFSIANTEVPGQTGTNTKIFIPNQFNFEYYERKVYSRHH